MKVLELLTLVLMVADVYCDFKNLGYGVQHILFKDSYIFVGATNTVLKLDSQLNEVSVIKDGPADDHSLCTIYQPKLECLEGRKPAKTPNNNQILVYTDTPQDSLIACGNLRQGTCRFIYANLSQVIFPEPGTTDFKILKLYRIASNTADATTISFATNVGTLKVLVSAKTVVTVHKAIVRSRIMIGVYQLDKTDDNFLKLVKTTAQGLPFTLEYADTNIYPSTLKTKDIELTKNFTIMNQHKFIAGQQFGDTLYFFTLFRAADNKLSSKVMRIELTESGLSKYIEQSLQCQNNGVKYNILVSISIISLSTQTAVNSVNGVINGVVMFGLFKSTLSSIYAVCLFHITKTGSGASIEERLNLSQERCKNGEKIPTADWLKDSGRCNRDSGEVTNRASIKLAPSDSIVGSFLLEGSRSETFGSIFAHLHERGIVLYLSKSDSTVKEISIIPEGYYVYGEVKVASNDQLFTSMTFHDKTSEIYLASSNGIGKMSIGSCSRRKTCKDCLSGPSCGWCTLQGICSLKSECDENEKPFHFNDNNTTQCPDITLVAPKFVSFNAVTKISITSRNLPPDTSYKCSFNKRLVSATPKDNYSVFVCNELDISTIPDVKTDGGSDIVSLSLVNSDGTVTIASSTITVSICSSFNMCKSCISGKFNCGWCNSLTECSDKNDTCLPLTNWIPYQGLNATTSKHFCPHITSIEKQFYASGATSDVTLYGAQLTPPQGNKKYRCSLVTDEGRSVATMNALWKNSSVVVCDSTTITYDELKNVIRPKVLLQYSKSIVNSVGLRVSIYKCSLSDKTDCSNCLNNPPQWRCGWCDTTKRCITRGSCPLPGSWRQNNCPKPVIEKVEPKTVAINSSTEISIYGRDLGSKPSDIISIVIADHNCDFLEEKYKISKRVVCRISGVNFVTAGPINLTLNSTGRIISKLSNSTVTFEQPSVFSIFPTNGPVSGGTHLQIQGEYLNVGNNISVNLNGVHCKNVSRSLDFLDCTTGASSKIDTTVKIIVDGYVIDTRALRFSYHDDPLISKAYTNKFSVFMETFASGGQEVNVHGQRLEYIQQPMMIFKAYSINKIYYSPCERDSKSKFIDMICLSPNVSAAMQGHSNTTVMVGFKLDGVSNYRNFENITVVADPVVEIFQGNVKTIKPNSHSLIIAGSGFSVLGIRDVTITVGGLPCRVTGVGENLVCELPDEKTLMDKKTNPGNPIVIVYLGIVGKGLEINVGSIEFEKEEEVPWLLYIIPATAAVVLLSIVIVVLACLYRKKQRRQKEYQALYQVNMDRIESQYARECKEAFAEYQTEITDLTHDVDESHLPLLSFRQYAMRVLYPGLSNHIILESNKDKRSEWEEAMLSFIRLLKVKDFLLTFVRTLESQSSFQMTDRCNVASLLTVALQDNVNFITEVLRELLVDLINKAGNGKRPKLLLRRTESIAEKLLTNWLAYTLHEFMEEHVGDRLFKMFTALNLLMEKEPVDAITFDAKNSLSEDKLLRQKIDFDTVLLDIEFINGDTNGNYTDISVLTCDTITQCKDKVVKHIFKNTPYTGWPPADDLSLGFVSANGAILVLQDEDSTNETEGEWKRLNTIEHYKVPNKSKLRLAPKGTMIASPYSGSAHPLASVSFQPSHASSPMLPNHHDVREPKLWHMVKVTDYPQEQKEDLRQSKMMAEVYLTRLLKTKETLQSFVNDLFNSIFGLHDGVRTIPLSVKYLFDFLDSEAIKLEIGENEVQHTWKNNSLPLRFWINMIKNPHFCFDVKKSNTVDSCLSVIAQLFMDSCSPDEHRLGKDSPANKLLYAKEIPEYKKKVKKFYVDVRESEFDQMEFEASLNKISRKYGKTFNSCNAAFELMAYAVKYKVKLMDSLEDNGYEMYADKLQDIMEKIPDD